MIFCPKCKTEKEPECFSDCSKRKNGKACYCKECVNVASRKRYEANKARRRATAKAWIEANREKYLEYCHVYNKRYREEHPDVVKAAQAKWRKENPERIRANDRRRYWRNPEKRNAIAKRQRRENPEHVRALARAAYERNKVQKNAWKDADRRQRIAVEWGKSSPIMRKTGFMLVSNGKEWRAARVGIPYAANETAYAYFQFHNGRWLVNNPPLRTPDPDLIIRFRRREARSQTVAAQTGGVA